MCAPPAATLIRALGSTGRLGCGDAAVNGATGATIERGSEAVERALSFDADNFDGFVSDSVVASAVSRENSRPAPDSAYRCVSASDGLAELCATPGTGPIGAIDADESAGVKRADESPRADAGEADTTGVGAPA